MATLRIQQRWIVLPRNKQGVFATENDVTLIGSRTKSGFLVHSSAGLTLIEVMIAMVVLGVGLLALASMQISAITSNSQASHISIATEFIGEKLDGYEAMDYANVNDEFGQTDNFAWKTTVTTPYSTFSDLKNVNVSVSWVGVDGPHSISFETVISQ